MTRSRGTLALVAGILAGGMLAAPVAAWGPPRRPPRLAGCEVRPGDYRAGAARGRRVALTFDDGPAPDTIRFVRVLERAHAPATFFLIGQQVPGHGRLLRRMLRDGDALGNHTYDHADVSAGGPAARREIEQTQAVIRRATGFTPCLLRPPYGADGRGLQATVRALGMVTVEWDVDPTDWARPGTRAIRDRLLGAVRPGAILLMHDGGGDRSETLRQLPGLIRALRARGYHLVTVPALLGARSRYAPAGFTT